jgi:hypothetical protein
VHHVLLGARHWNASILVQDFESDSGVQEDAAEVIENAPRTVAARVTRRAALFVRTRLSECFEPRRSGVSAIRSRRRMMR